MKKCFGKYPNPNYPCEICMDKSECIKEDPKGLKNFVLKKFRFVKIQNSKEEIIMNISCDNILLGDDCLTFFTNDIITLKISLDHIKKIVEHIIYI